MILQIIYSKCADYLILAECKTCNYLSLIKSTEMNTNETLQQMQQLKFHGMQASYSMQLDLPIHQQLEAHELIAQLIQAELLSRNNERTAYYLKLAKLR